jgi:hypothetical protein
MLRAALSLADLDQLTDSEVGCHDVPCPHCGPERRSPVNRRRRVMRVWRLDPGFASYHCARCDLSGHTRDRSAPRPDPAALARVKLERAQREKVSAADRLKKARWLWSKRQPITGTVAENYLRVRGYQGVTPPTLGFLPARGKHGPAMIAAFEVPDEPAPGELAIADYAVVGVHLTRLLSDGSGKAGTEADKIMIGKSAGWPIVLAPANDLLGLAVTEGIENALSVYEATGLGCWAAGCASRLPALSTAIPPWIEAVTIVADDDPDGRRFAHDLAQLLERRGFGVRLVVPTGTRPAA